MLASFFFAVALFALAKPVARWIADRSDSTGRETKFSPSRETPPTAEDKDRQLQDQVNAKIHWDAPEHEVLAWLEEKHNITGERAQLMLAAAQRQRVRAIREKSLYGLVLSGIATVATGIPLAFQVMSGNPPGPISLLLAFGACFLWCGRHTLRLVSGRTEGPIDG